MNTNKNDRIIKGLFNVTNPKTQKEVILKHLLENKMITSWYAIKSYRVTRLADVIFQLKYHFDIESKDTKDGKKRFTTYIYKGYKKTVRTR